MSVMLLNEALHGNYQGKQVEASIIKSDHPHLQAFYIFISPNSKLSI